MTRDALHVTLTRDALHVTRDTQDISAKKQQQGTKMQELEHKLASVAQVEISLELILIMYTADIVTEQGDAREDSLQHP